jgi:hypothetical protein
MQRLLEIDRPNSFHPEKKRLFSFKIWTNGAIYRVFLICPLDGFQRSHFRNEIKTKRGNIVSCRFYVDLIICNIILSFRFFISIAWKSEALPFPAQFQDIRAEDAEDAQRKFNSMARLKSLVDASNVTQSWERTPGGMHVDLYAIKSKSDFASP